MKRKYVPLLTRLERIMLRYAKQGRLVDALWVNELISDIKKMRKERAA